MEAGPDTARLPEKGFLVVGVRGGGPGSYGHHPQGSKTPPFCGLSGRRGAGPGCSAPGPEACVAEGEVCADGMVPGLLFLPSLVGQVEGARPGGGWRRSPGLTCPGRSTHARHLASIGDGKPALRALTLSVFPSSSTGTCPRPDRRVLSFRDVTHGGLTPLH